MVIGTRRTIDAEHARQLAIERGVAHRKIKPVTARRTIEREMWTSGSGQTLQGHPGDWAVTDGESTWTVAEKIFQATYEPVPQRPGMWRKAAVTVLVRMETPFTVLTLEGAANGEAGDFLAVGDHDDAWPISRDCVEGSYEPVNPEDERDDGGNISVPAPEHRRDVLPEGSAGC